MSGTDFFDDDLVARREETPLSVGGGPAGMGEQERDEEGAEISSLAISRIARHKEQVAEQVAKASEELEILRQRQADLEREKRELEELRRKQDAFLNGKREMLENLEHNLVALEKEQVRAEQLVGLLSETRAEFKKLLAEIEALDEESWPEDEIRDELTHALAVIEDARMQFNKDMAKIQAVTPGRGEEGGPAPMIMEESPRGVHERGLGEWVKIGFAVSLPVVLTIVILFAVYLVLRVQALI